MGKLSGVNVLVPLSAVLALALGKVEIDDFIDQLDLDNIDINPANGTAAATVAAPAADARVERAGPITLENVHLLRPGDRVRVVRSDTGNAGMVLPVAPSRYNNNLVTLSKPRNRLGFNEQDVAEGKLAFA